MDRLTRKELKTDKFAAEVSRTVEFLEEHRRESIIIGVIAVVVVLAATGTYFYRKHEHLQRQRELRQALLVFEAPIGPNSNPYIVTFPTKEAKEAAVQKQLHGLIEKYPGTDEAAIAAYYLGVDAATKGDEKEAEKWFRTAMASDNKVYASQASFSLAQLYAGIGKTEEAEKLLRELVAHPTILVSKEQATIALARVLGKKNPEEARKLLEPLRTERSAVSRAALTALGELSRQP